jgi:hypothetical protein
MTVRSVPEKQFKKRQSKENERMSAQPHGLNFKARPEYCDSFDGPRNGDPV